MQARSNFSQERGDYIYIYMSRLMNLIIVWFDNYFISITRRLRFVFGNRQGVSRKSSADSKEVTWSLIIGVENKIPFPAKIGGNKCDLKNKQNKPIEVVSHLETPKWLHFILHFRQPIKK